MSFDVEKLRLELMPLLQQYPPVMVTDQYGGWSALSSTGSYDDGFGTAYRAYDPTFMPGKSVEEKRVALGVKDVLKYREPTELCVGYLRDMLVSLRDAGFSPLRARVALLKAGGSTSLHRDAPEGAYAVRLHIPIVTNDKCFIEFEEGRIHLPADGGGYLIRVDRPHRAFNDGEADRFHFVAGFWDMKHVTKHHQYTRKASPT